MNNLQRFIIAQLFLTVFLLPVSAQEKTDSGTAVQAKASLNYISSLHYFGRTDSLKSSGYFPMAELWFHNSFYVNAAPVYIRNNLVPFEYAGTVATAGYQFLSDNRWFGHFYAVKPFYRQSSELVQAALKAQTGFSLSWLNNVADISAGADLKFSENTDVGLIGSIDRIIRVQLGEKTVLVVDPTAEINAGTQQFNRSYLRKRNGFLLIPGSEEMVTESARKLSILSYEFSAPVILAAGKLHLSLTPAYVIPQNLLTVEGRPDLSERGSNMFYITAGIKMNF